MRFRLITLASLFSLVFFGLDPNCLSAQTRETLEKQRLEIIQRIENSDNALSKIASSKKTSLKDFRLLERKIKDRERLISNIQNDLLLSENELNLQQNETEVLRRDLQVIKDRYYKLLNAVYKQHHSYNKWAFIFNAQSINDSFQRWKYIKQYETYCRGEYENLVIADQEVKNSINELNRVIADRQSLLDQESSQFELIQQELKQKDDLIAGLADREDELKIALSQQKKEREKLNSAIENFIISALSGVEENSIAEVSSNPNVGSGFALNRGKLIWPTESGFVITRFGRQKHPTLKDVYVNNNGIDIQTGSASQAKAVYAGEIVGISEIPGFAMTVIVKHEEYYTVYSKLKQVYVSEKQFINAGTSIGDIDVDDEGQHVMHFEVWKGKNKLNPINWLKKK